MKSIIQFQFVLLFLLPIGILFGQKFDKIKFTRSERMPTQLFGMAYCTEGQSAYVIGGGNDRRPFNRSLFAYDTKIQKWLNLTRHTKIEAQRYSSAVYSPELNSLLIFGGLSETQTNIIIPPAMITYSLDTRRINVLSRNQLDTKKPGADYWEGKVYLFGGSLSKEKSTSYNQRINYSKDFYQFDPINLTWEKLPDLPEAKEVGGAIIDGELFLFGGYADLPQKAIHRYHIENQNWEKIGEFDEPVSAYAIAKWEKYIFLIGDYKHGNQMIVFDTKSLTWSKYEMNLRTRHAGAVVIKDQLHVYGGVFESSTLEIMDEHWVLDLSSINWGSSTEK